MSAAQITKQDVHQIVDAAVSQLASLISNFALSVDQRFDKLEAEIAVMKADIVVMKSDIEAMKSDIVVMKSDIEAMKSDISDLKTDNYAIHRELHEINQRLDHLDGEVAAIRADLKELYDADQRNYRQLKQIVKDQSKLRRQVNYLAKQVGVELPA